jgi:hypothetical protein
MDGIGRRAELTTAPRLPGTIVSPGEQKMAKEFQNPVETKVENETATDTSSKQKVQDIADKAAEKPAKTEKKFDKDNNQLFSK